MSLYPAPSASRARRSLQITEDLKNMISNGELVAGRRIPTEAEICQRYGVSRTTVREALQSLRSTGMLEVTPGRGSYVRRPDPAPMLRELAVVLIASGVTPPEALFMQQAMLHALIPAIAHSAPASRQELYQHVSNHMATPAQNVALESRWFLTLTRLSNQALAGCVMQLLLNLTHLQRQQLFANALVADGICQAQLRFSRAVCDGDFAAADRLVPTLFSSNQVPAANAA